jgi:hypothetical protein
MPLWVCLALLAASLVGACFVYRDDIAYFLGTDRDQEDAAARAHEQMNARMVKR